MGVVFDLYVFVQRLYQAATGSRDEVVNTVARENRKKKKKRARKGETETCKHAEEEDFSAEHAHLVD